MAFNSAGEGPESERYIGEILNPTNILTFIFVK